MGRYQTHQTDPLKRFSWLTAKRMKAGEVDDDLGKLLLSLAADLDEEVVASAMARASAARYLDLYARLESGATADLLTHSRGVSQLVALEKSIRAGARVRTAGGGRRAMWQNQKSDEGQDDAA